ncbi:MAG: zf-HC2 domain-containing protein [Planctomycetes bacterium]|nr:zf-HC2 domain-containing protein [Planctomycetota bacterium]
MIDERLSAPSDETNMTCERTHEIHRYHDGELSPTERSAVESHVTACAECRRLLAELRGLSLLISRMPRTVLPEVVLRRLSECRHAATDRAVLRIAGWMTAAAAAVLIGALLIRQPVVGGETNHRPSVWETVAVTPTPPSEAADGPNSELVLAQWMADDLSWQSSGDLR